MLVHHILFNLPSLNFCRLLHEVQTKDLRCEQCGKAFKDKDTLNKHIRIHADTRNAAFLSYWCCGSESFVCGESESSKLSCTIFASVFDRTLNFFL
jgi:hypothetical protein